MLCRDENPEWWELVGLLMDHDEERRQEVDYWQMFQVHTRIGGFRG